MYKPKEKNDIYFLPKYFLFILFSSSTSLHLRGKYLYTKNKNLYSNDVFLQMKQLIHVELKWLDS